MKYVVIVTACLLAGCAPRPAFQRPPVTAPDVYRAGTSEAASIGDQKWWEVFKDESLQELIRKAVADNFDVKIAATRMLEAETRIVITRSAQFPVLNGTGGMVTQRSAKSGPFPAFGVTAAQLGVAGSFNADFWGKYRSATDASRANLLAAGWAKQEVLNTLVANVAAGYFLLRELDLELEVAKRTVGSRKESLDLIKTLEEHGLITLIDVRQAEQLVDTAAAQIPQLERQIEQQENAISVLLGANPGAIKRGLAIGAQPHMPEVPAGLPSALLERRPDIRQIEANLLAADAQIAVARAEIFLADRHGRFPEFRVDALVQRVERLRQPGCVAGGTDFQRRTNSRQHPPDRRAKARAGVDLSEDGAGGFSRSVGRVGSVPQEPRVP